MRVGFIGLGKLGLTCAEAMATKYSVTGYDIHDRVSDSISIVTDMADAVKDQDIVFVAVQTPHHPEYDGSKPTAHMPNKDFDYTQVKQVLNEVNEYVDTNTMVVLISTVLRGTVSRELSPLIAHARYI